MGASFSFSTQLDPVALYAAFVATVIAVVEIAKALSTKTRIKASVMARARTLGRSAESDDVCAAIQVENVGTRPTEITSLGMLYWKSWVRRHFRPNQPDEAFFVKQEIGGVGMGVPHFLEASKRWIGAARHNDRLISMAKGDYLYFAVYCTGRKNPLLCRIRIRD